MQINTTRKVSLNQIIPCEKAPFGYTADGVNKLDIEYLEVLNNVLDMSIFGIKCSKIYKDFVKDPELFFRERNYGAYPIELLVIAVVYFQARGKKRKEIIHALENINYRKESWELKNGNYAFFIEYLRSEKDSFMEDIQPSEIELIRALNDAFSHIIDYAADILANAIARYKQKYKE